MVFSVREAKELYERAVAKAWKQVQERLQDAIAANPGKKYELVAVSYDPLPGESIIDELPEQPKSSRPQAVEVSIRLCAMYSAR